MSIVRYTGTDSAEGRGTSENRTPVLGRLAACRAVNVAITMACVVLATDGCAARTPGVESHDTPPPSLDLASVDLAHPDASDMSPGEGPRVLEAGVDLEVSDSPERDGLHDVSAQETNDVRPEPESCGGDSVLDAGPDFLETAIEIDGDGPSVSGCPSPDAVVLPEGACCTPDCTGRVCGSDGCMGQCGECAAPEVCGPTGTCCEPACDGKKCGPDGCGGFCGQCGAFEPCYEHACCEVDCAGKHCGSNGCGGSCGVCHPATICYDNECVAATVECDDGNAEPWDGCDAGKAAFGPTRVDTKKEVFEEFDLLFGIGSVAACPTSEGRVVVTWHRTEVVQEGVFYSVADRVMDPGGLQHCSQDGGSGSGPGASSPWPSNLPVVCSGTVAGGVSTTWTYVGCPYGGWTCAFFQNIRHAPDKCKLSKTFMEEVDDPGGPTCVRLLSPAQDEDLWVWSGASLGGVRFMRYGADGDMLEQGEAVWSKDAGESRRFDAVALDSQFVAVALEAGPGTEPEAIRVVRANRHLELVALLGEIVGEEGTTIHSPAMAKAGTDGLVVAWIAEDSEGEKLVAAKLTGVDGQSNFIPFFAAAMPDTTVSEPRLASLDGGMSALLWVETGTSFEQLVMAIAAVSDGSLLAQSVLAEGLPGDLKWPSLMALQDGTLAAVWVEELHDQTLHHQAVFLQHLNSSGDKMWGHCNNGLCDTGETCQLCPKDCGLCAW